MKKRLLKLPIIIILVGLLSFYSSIVWAQEDVVNNVVDNNVTIDDNIQEQEEKEENTPAEEEVNISEQEPSVMYQTHVQRYGYLKVVKDGEIGGTVKQSLRMEAIKISLNNTLVNGDIEYQAYVQNNGWQDWVQNGEQAGTVKKSLRMEAIRIKLTGEVSDKYDVYYRVHTQKFGWLDWTSNGEIAGTIGYNYRIEAIQIKLIKNGELFNESTSNSSLIKPIEVKYQVHVQKYGYLKAVTNGEIGGTVKQSLRMEAIKISLNNALVNGGIEYQAYVQNKGWQSWVQNGAQAGTVKKSLHMEAIRIKLTGEVSDEYDVYYRVHTRKFGWLDWTSNGDAAGTIGYNYRLEAIQIVLVKKGDNAPGKTENHYLVADVEPRYNVYVNKRWQGNKLSGSTAGAAKSSNQIEAIKVDLYNKLGRQGDIEYQVHTQTYGWKDWVSSSKQAGIIGKRVEAIRIRLTGDIADMYDIYYRTYIESYGWLDWAKNGDAAGSSSIAFKMFGIQIKMVPKGSNAPGDTTRPFVTGGFKTENGHTYYYRDGKMLNDWSTIDGKKYFFNSLGHLIASDAKFIIDVSEFQDQINWDEVKRQGKVDGVIVRTGFASVTEDKQLSRNIAALNRLGIPYGIYHFSYAENAKEAELEADFVLKLIKKYNIKPTLGIYYDIENWSIKGKYNTISVATYDKIIPAFVNKLKKAGYTAKVYTGLNYADNRLSSTARSYVTWIAQYNHFCQYSGYYNMWQYGGELVSGISGKVDSNVMSNKFVKNG